MLYLTLLLIPLAAAEQVPDYGMPYSPIFTDKPVYSWTDKVKITIHAPSWNSDRYLIDEIGGYPEHAIKVSTGDFYLDRYRLAETDVDSGIFTGEVTLTGFLHDADGDGDYDTNPRTSGSGPTNGFLETERDSGLTVSFEFADGVVLVESVPISWNAGTVRFLEDRRPDHSMVRVVDADMNLNPEATDQLWIDVFSDSDTAGLEVAAIETGPDSGIFDADILLRSDAASSGSRLFAIPGDAIRASYEDRTLPRPYGLSETLTVSAVSVPDSDTLPVWRLEIGNVTVSDRFGSAVSQLVADQQIQIAGTLQNNHPYEQPFEYLTQVRDSEGTVVKIFWISGALSPDGTMNLSQSWTPAAPGSYTIESFAWKSAHSMVPLSEPGLTTVFVD